MDGLAVLNKNKVNWGSSSIIKMVFALSVLQVFFTTHQNMTIIDSDLPTRRFESKLADLPEHVFALLGQLLHLWARVHFTGKTRQN